MGRQNYLYWHLLIGQRLHDAQQSRHDSSLPLGMQMAFYFVYQKNDFARSRLSDLLAGKSMFAPCPYQ